MSGKIPSKEQVKKAGKLLLADATNKDAMEVLSLWRSLHVYPISGFQTLLCNKIKDLNIKQSVVAQRLKRTPSIIRKLQRNPSMSLARMQDLGGIRAIVPTVQDVYALHNAVVNAHHKHEAILPPTDYIKSPKEDGYRSLHQCFKYFNDARPELNGLVIEVQIRTQLQHYWATAVETLGTIEKTSFKTGQGEQPYKEFFRLASALFADAEKQPLPSSYHHHTPRELVAQCKQLEKILNIFNKLEGVSVAANHADLKNKNAYYLIELNHEDMSVMLTPFEASQVEVAERFYKLRELEVAVDQANVDLVLISVGSLKAIKTAYPNYFLDTQAFIKQLKKIFNALG